MNHNNPISIECAAVDQGFLMPALNIGFNHKPNFQDRIGGYNARFIPDKSYMSSGDGSDERMARTISKHRAVVRSLTRLSTKDISSLNKSITLSNGTNATLKSLLLGIPYPPNDPTSKKTLFFSADKAEKGRDAEANVTYITAYNDRAGLAGALLKILPAYFDFLCGHAAHSFFTPESLQIINDVTLDMDSNDQWTGKWYTVWDELMDDCLDEDMGVTLEIEGLNLLGGQQRVILEADDATQASFNTVFGQARPIQGANPQQAGGLEPSVGGGNSNTSETNSAGTAAGAPPGEGGGAGTSS
jgi:hypothetical protein